MDAQLSLLLNLGGDLVPVHPKLSDSLRSVIAAAQIHPPPNSQLICLSRGERLQMDLSLGYQGIKQDDTIVIMCRRDQHHQEARRQTQETSDEQQIFNEAVRVSDTGFLIFEWYKKKLTPIIYQAILDQQDVDSFAEDEEEETILEPAPAVCCDPLPCCWDTDE